MRKKLHTSKYLRLVLTTTSMIFFLAITQTSWATVANWLEPDLDTWIYPEGQGAGGRPYASSFTGGLELDLGNNFVERPSDNPARLGSMMMAFDTSSSITLGLLPERYSIQSVTVTTRMANSFTGSIYYEDQAPTPAGYLADVVNSELSAQQAVELFGVGFREGYTGYDFQSGSDPTLFKEGTFPYSAADGGYVPYPIVGDSGQPGQYHDASNNITGGFSATDGSNHTDPFQADPWAIGNPGVSVGNAVPLDTTFSFDVNLSAPGVVSYLQQSLSDGGLGFILSSMHNLAQYGSSGAAPNWYTKEGVGVAPEAPTLEIEYSILPIPGDFNFDDKVDTVDFDLWQASFGDGGIYDGFDFLNWQRNFSSPPSVVAAVAVPEPSSLALLVTGTLLALRLSRNTRHQAKRT